MSVQDIIGGAQIAIGADPELDALLSSGDYTGWQDIIGAEPGLAPPPPHPAAVHPAHMRHYNPHAYGPLGFPVATLDAGGSPAAPTSAVSMTAPQVVYRGRRLFVVPSALGVCIVQDLKIGKDSQLTNSEPLPAEMFSPLSFGGDMNLDTAQVSMIVALFLGNIGTAAISVSAGIQGTAIY